jgi:hypothetical protein
MADFDFKSEIVSLGGVDSTSGGYTHDSVLVTVTATMKQGSLLKADGTEAATAEAATIVGAIDDLTFRRHLDELEVGDEVLAAVAKRGLILNESALVYTDGAIDAAGKAALAAAGLNKFSTVADDSSII